MNDNWPAPTTPPPPPAKMSTGKKVLIGIGVLFAIGFVSNVGDTPTDEPTHATPVTTAPYRPTPTTTSPSVTAADVVDFMGAATVAEFCDLYDASSEFMSESEMYRAFAEGYGTNGPPYASAVWAELKSRCFS